MKKALKIIFGIFVALLLFIVLAVVTLPIWLGPVVKPVANTVVPKVTLVDFNLGHIYLNPFTGRFELGNLCVGNPKGYNEPVAAALSNLTVDVSMKSISGDTLHIEEITVSNLFVSYEQGGEYEVDNFTQIQYNVAGGKEKYDAAQAQEKEAVKCEGDKCEVPQEEEGSPAPAKKFVIDKLSISGIKLKYGAMVIPLPKLTLTDLGKESDGITGGELFAKIGNEIMSQALDLAAGLSGLLDAGASKASDATSAVCEGTKTAVSDLSEGAKSAASAVGDSAAQAFDSVGDGTKKAAKALGDLFK